MKRLFLLITMILAMSTGMLAQGTTWQTATTINRGGSGTGTLDNNNNDVYFKIDVPEEGSVKITMTLTGNLSMNFVELCWYRASDNSYPSRISTGWYPESGKSFEMTNAGKGTYYLHAQRRGGGGTVTLNYQFTACSLANDNESNDAAGSGVTLINNQAKQGRIGYRDANDKLDEDDWYKIEVPQDGRVDIIYDCDQTYELELNFIDLCRYRAGDDSYPYRVSTGWYVRKGTLTMTDAGKGTYYIHMQRRGGHGGYTLKYVFTPNKYGNDDEPNDNGGQGSTIAIGQTMQGHLGYREGDDYLDENDWYKIEVPQDGRVDLVYDCNQTYNLELNFIDLCRYREGDDSYPNRVSTGWYVRSDTLTMNDAGKGTYYIHMQRRGGHGGYTLKYLFTPNNYPNDEEPNNELSQATQTISNDESMTGHLGYRDGNDKTDADDWILLDTNNASTMLLVTVETDSTSTLELNFGDIVRKKGDQTSTVASSGWYPESPFTLALENVDEDAQYYVHLQRRNGHGGYNLTYGAIQRSETSMVRVHYIGNNSTRLGIPSPFQVKIENIDSHPSGSFFLVIPASDDVKLLYAECPCDTGVVRYTMDDLGGEDTNCATFVVPNLDPFESYTFTMYAEGRVDGKAAFGPNHAVITGTLIAVGAYVGTIAVGMAVDKVTEYLTEKANKKLMPEEKLEHYARTYSLTMDQLKEDKKKYHLGAHAIKTMAKNAGENVMKAVPGGAPVATAMGVVENVNGVAPSLRRRFFLEFGRAKALDDILAEDPPTQTLDAKVGATRKVSSWDPNEMCGPVGFGDEGYIGETKTMDYRILFENKKEATAPAYRIRISDVLDENVFDVSTVRFGQTSHEGTDYNWKMSREGNKLSWDIEGIELPPNVNAPDGEGYVTFSVNLKPGLKNMTKIKNKATIIFDYNEPIETNEYVNTLDLTAPTSRVSTVSFHDNQFVVSCKGEDAESGVSFYKYYYSTDGSEFKLYAESNSPEFFIPLEQGKKADDYTFYVVAVDNVGNTQLAQPEPWVVALGIDDTAVSSVASDDWSITTLGGTIVASGNGVPALQQLPAGIYIIRQGRNVKKIVRN